MADATTGRPPDVIPTHTLHLRPGDPIDVTIVGFPDDDVNPTTWTMALDLYRDGEEKPDIVASTEDREADNASLVPSPGGPVGLSVPAEVTAEFDDDERRTGVLRANTNGAMGVWYPIRVVIFTHDYT